jgi:adenylylsulfate reductase subunit B
MGHSVRVLREEEKGTISWKVKFRNGTVKNFVSPITTKPWGKHIPKLTEKEVPNKEALDSQLLFSEPNGLNIDTGLPEMKKERFKQGVYY